MTVSKKDIVGKNRNPEYALTLEEYMSVSTMSIRFYIAAKLPLHYLELSIAFSGCTRSGLRRSLDAWEEVARNEVAQGRRRSLQPVAKRNAINRGDGGTHCAGSRNFERFKAKLVCIYMERPAFNSRHVPT